ncbi:MAG: lysophospholipid acyltransferase family protein [Anaerolineaceae bacterium]|nr:lysophospholipid acyltransferase family protein [Anaerolineaceae bacterium]
MVQADIDQTLNNPFLLQVLFRITQTASPKTARGILNTWKKIRGLFQIVDKLEQQLVSNLEEVFAEERSKKELRKIASECFYLRSLAIYDFYHYRNDIASLRKRIHVTPKAKHLIEHIAQSKRGAIALSPHFVGADVVAIALAQQIKNIQVISIANPKKSYQLDNQIRKDYGLWITPASMTALRSAAQTLKAGGMVATGIDRAFPEEHFPLEFFGKPAYLPTFYIRLALRYQVPIYHFVGLVDSDGNYTMEGAGPIWLKKYPSLKEEVIENSKEIIALTESAIQTHPEQWSMFHPIWADQFEKEKVNNVTRRINKKESQSATN